MSQFLGRLCSRIALVKAMLLLFAAPAFADTAEIECRFDVTDNLTAQRTQDFSQIEEQILQLRGDLGKLIPRISGHAGIKKRVPFGVLPSNDFLFTEKLLRFPSHLSGRLIMTLEIADLTTAENLRANIDTYFEFLVQELGTYIHNKYSYRRDFAAEVTGVIFDGCHRKIFTSPQQQSSTCVDTDIKMSQCSRSVK